VSDDACHPLVVSATKFGKGRTATFWKTGPDADRAKLLDEWTAWWSSKKPAK